MFPLKMLKIIFKRNIWWTCILLAYQVISSQPFLVGHILKHIEPLSPKLMKHDFQAALELQNLLVLDFLELVFCEASV